MADFNLSLEVKQVGADAALADLDKLSKSGQMVVERFAKATGTAIDAAIAQYKSLGDKAAMEMLRIAVAAEKSADRQTAAAKRALEVADRHAQVLGRAEIAAYQMQAAMDKVNGTIEHGTKAHEPHIAGLSRIGNSLASLVGHATGVPPIFEKIGDAIGVMAVGHLATVGVLAGFAAIAFAYEKITERAREAEKQAAATMKEFDRIAHLDIRGQGEAAQLLYSGDPNATDPMAVAGVQELRRQRANFERRSRALMPQGGPGGVTMVMTDDAKEAAKALERVNDELERREKLLTSMSVSMQRAGEDQARRDLPGFISDQIAAAEKAGKDAARAYRAAWDKAVREFAKGVDERGKAMQSQAQSIAATMIENDDLMRASWGFPTKEAIRETTRQIGVEIEAAIRADPFLAAGRAIEQRAKELAKHIQESFAKNLGDAVVNGISAAFSGKGVLNAVKAFGAGILDAIGSFAEQLGASMIVFGSFLAAFVKHVQGFDGFGAIAAGVGLVAAGAAIRALAASFGGGAASTSSAVSGGGVSAAPSFLSFGVQAQTTPTTMLAAPTARAANQFTIIGPDDPKAQRAIADIVNRADARGLIR